MPCADTRRWPQATIASGSPPATSAATNWPTRESAGERFQRVKNPALAGYVATEFKTELAAVKDREPETLLTEDFDGYDEGVPNHWALVQTRGSEFRVVEVPARPGPAAGRGQLPRGRVPGRRRGVDRLHPPVRGQDRPVARQLHGRRRRLSPSPTDTGYVLELSPDSLRITRQFASRPRGRQDPAHLLEPLKLGSALAEVHLDQPPAIGWWYTLKIRVQKVEGGVNVAGKFWRSDVEEPLQWQVVWTDIGQAGGEPFTGGAAGAQVSGAKVLIDNFIVLRNEPLKESH